VSDTHTISLNQVDSETSFTGFPQDASSSNSWWDNAIASDPASRIPPPREPLPHWSNRSEHPPLPSTFIDTLAPGQSTFGLVPNAITRQLPTDPRIPETEDNSEEDDPLVSAVRNEPFRMMTNREENRRLRQEGHAAAPSSHYENTPSDYDDSRKSKRAKTTPGDSAYDAAGRLVRKKGDTSGMFLDPVQLGFVTEEQGRAMFDQYVQAFQLQRDKCGYAHFRYMRYSHPFIPVMDPIYDTWER
jgi:hypothetical protein